MYLLFQCHGVKRQTAHCRWVTEYWQLKDGFAHQIYMYIDNMEIVNSKHIQWTIKQTAKQHDNHVTQW